MRCGIAKGRIAIPHLNYRTATVESSRLTICGLNYLPIDVHAHTSGHTVAIQAKRTRAFTRGAGAHRGRAGGITVRFPAAPHGEQMGIAGLTLNGAQVSWASARPRRVASLSLDPATTRGMTKGWRRGMTR